MSFFTNCITSFFPDSYAINSDHSSNGYRFYSSLSKIMENVYYENYVLSKYASFENEVFQLGHMYGLSLLAKDSSEIKDSYDPWPVIFSKEKRLTLVKSFVDFFYSPPDKFIVGEENEIYNWKIWSSQNSEYFENINEADHLSIDLTAIDEFFPLLPNVPSEKDSAFSQNYVICIEGLDAGYNEIKETISVFSKEVFVTKYQYKELTFVDWDGFEGDFNIYLTSKNQINKSFVSETDYSSHHKSRRGIKYDIFSDSNFSYLRNEMVLNRFVSNRNLTYDERFLFLLDRAFLNEDGEAVKAIDFCRDPRNKLFYILSSDNKLFCYNDDLHPFSDLSKEVSENTYVAFSSCPARCTLNEELDFGILFKNRRGSGEYYCISRIDPDGIESWWDGQSWVSSLYKFNLNLDIWKNNRVVAPSFESYFDKFGQWEFYFEIKFEEFVQSQVIGKAVFCEYLKPIKSYSIPFDKVFDGIYFNKYRKLAVSSGLYTFELEEHFDIYTYSNIINEIMFRNYFDSVEIIMPSFLSVRKSGLENCFYVDEFKTKSINLRGGERHILNQSTLSCTFPLCLSNSPNRSQGIINKKSVVYLVDYNEVSYTDYKKFLISGEYDDIEILFTLEEGETLYCYSEDDKDLSLTINSTDNDNFLKIGEQYGSL